MMKNTFFLIALVFCGLAACTDQDTANTDENVIEKEPISAAKANINQQLSQPPTLPELPEDAPEIGTAVTAMINVIKPASDASKAEETADSGDVAQIMWEDLIPKDFQPDSIMAKYQAQIDNIPEGSAEEKILFDKIMSEFNDAPPNDTLNGKQVRIPGFVTPLDEHKGMVKEFLLVPYFGSCIHSPPPPVNQTILVKPLEGKSISLEEIYEPVWVTGLMKVEFSNTDLAQAGYLIESAQLEIYQEEEAD